MVDIDVMPDASEVVHYDRAGIPLYIRRGILSDYPSMRALCHWHEDFEFIRILEGEMNYFINGETILLEAGDCLFVNSKMVHYGYSNHNRECLFLCTLVHPELISGNQTIYTDYIADLQNESPYVKISYDHPESETFRTCLDYIYEIKCREQYAYELDAVGSLTRLIAAVYRSDQQQRSDSSENDSRLTAYKIMVGFISKHFSEDISLAEIAASASVSKSTCIRMFQDYAQQSPYEFLITYRLHVSCNFLENTEKTITEIAGLCGFNHASYFSKVFLQKYGCQPHKYRLIKGKNSV